MNVLALVPPPAEMARSDPFWLGSLSMAAALALGAPEKEAQKILQRTLDEFLSSPLPSEELRQMLREEMKR